MPLATPQDLAILSAWSLFRAYLNNKDQFVEVGKIAYHALVVAGPQPNGPNDVELSLYAALQATDIFKKICVAKAFARPSFYPTFAMALARYILDTEWTAITSP